MISRQDKALKVARFAERLAASEAVIVAENGGLTATEMAELRRQLRACGGGAQVVKNMLAKRALAGGRFAALSDKLTGPLVYGTGADPAAVAKVFADIAAKYPKLIIRVGALPARGLIDEGNIKALAKLPTREILLAQLLGSIQAPTAHFVRTLNAVPAAFVRLLAAVRRNKES